MARVLVVEDDAEVRNLLKAILESEHHEVLTAADTREADIHLTTRPDAAFVDVDMPGETGAEFLIRLRVSENGTHMPAMFCTAFRDRLGRLAASGLAQRQVLEKPFRKQQVLDALGVMLKT